MSPQSHDAAAVQHDIMGYTAACTGPAHAERVDSARWDSLLDGFDDVTSDQSALYAAHRWGDEKVVCLVVRDANGEILGGATCLRFSLPLLGGLVYAKFGPVWRRRGEPAIIERYTAIVSAIRDYAAELGLALTLVTRPHPDFTPLEAEELHRLGFTSGLDIVDDRYMVDCALSSEDQMASLAQTWRANLRKSDKAGVEIVDLDDTSYSEFEALYGRMMTRKQVTLYDPVEIVPKLRAHFSEEMRPQALLARHNGEAVAGIVYAVFGDVAYYMYGASSEKALPVRGGYALQWAVLDRLRGRVRWYDLGGAPDGGLSLHQFKSGLVGKAGLRIGMPCEFNYAATFRATCALFLIQTIRRIRLFVRNGFPNFRRA